ncbi:major facilitator superfamily domain-containing protein [Aspergillus pseudodeflectus]|uniref:Major facilitator superfamily domain-containing protein n=1 Tax=Aspergillus pseudodeflectus TaxID=176178 RepID=A0ABR4JQ27_9EURO
MEMKQEQSPGSTPGTEPPSTDEMEYPSGLPLAIIMGGLVASIFLIALDTTIVSTAIPRITDEFHTVGDIGWYGSAFFLTLASFQGTWGKIYRYFPLKTSFAASVLLFELGSLICAIAQNSITLIVGRAISGIGAAGISSGSYTILAFSVRPEQRPAMTGLLGASFAVASVAGPLIGGAFTEHSTWRWCFWINLPIGGLAAALIIFFFTTPAQTQAKHASWKEVVLAMDISGIVLLLGAILCFLLALQWGGSAKSWNDADVIGTLIGFAILLILFCINEFLLKDRAMIPPRLLANRTLFFSSAFTLFFCSSFYVLLYYLPIYFQSVKEASAADSGVRTLPLVLGNGLFATISGFVLGVIGYYLPLLTLGGTLCTIASGLLYTLDISSGAAEWIGYQAMAGIGIGIAIQVPMIASQAVVEMQDLSTISAMVLFFQCIGGAIFVQAGQAAFTNRLVNIVHESLPEMSTHLITATGATELRTAFTGKELDVVLHGYVQGLKDCYILSIVLAGLATVLALGSGWRSLKGKTNDQAGQA